jgi:hypothetical protein
VLHLARRIALGLDVGNLLELVGILETVRLRKHRTASFADRELGAILRSTQRKVVFSGAVPYEEDR